MKKALKDICSMIHRGKTPKYVEESDVLVFAQKCNLQKGGIDLNKCLCLDTTNLKKWTTEDYLHKNDIVINSTGTGTLGRVGFFDIDSEKPVVPDTHVTVVRVSDKETYSKWVYYFLKYSQNYLISKGHGSTKQQELATSEIEKIEIPLPSYAYQENGAHHLDSIQSAIDNKKQQLQQLDELVKSKFVEMFGDVKEQVSIKEICDVSGGYSFKSGDISENPGIRILQIGNVALNDVSWEVTNYLPKDFEKKHESFLLKKDDIVMALTRPIIQSLGNVKTCLVKSTDLPCLLNQRVGKIRAKFGTNIRFVYYCFMQHSFTDYVQSCCKGSSQPNMSTKDIENYEIPKVDENLQNTFAEYVQKIDSAKSIIKNQLTDLQELLDSKMDEYFGE